ncbi:MAG TPA: cupredoxin domain-containing protein, partial [Candidatus Limnocylindrales bacterium]
ASPSPAPSGSPATSSAPPPSGSPGTSSAPAPSGSLAAAGPTLQITASGIQYVEKSLTAPAGTPFQIDFDNQDPGTPHNVSIHKDSPTGDEVFKGEVFPGVAKKTYDIPALAAGTYAYVCTVHPTMTGTLTVQ